MHNVHEYVLILFVISHNPAFRQIHIRTCERTDGRRPKEDVIRDKYMIDKVNIGDCISMFNLV